MPALKMRLFLLFYFVLSLQSLIWTIMSTGLSLLFLGLDNLSFHFHYMWFSDLFKKDATVLNYSYTNGEKVLCRLHDRLSEGALTINDIIKEIHLPYPQSTFRGLCEAGYVRHWTYHGHPSDPLNMSFLITKK